MKKLITNRAFNLVVSFILILTISGCDAINNLQQPSAKEVLNAYLSASLKKDGEEAYKHISNEDKTIKSLNEYKSETEKKNSSLAQTIQNDVSFKILNVSESEDSATANVEITLPDVRLVFKDLMGMALNPNSGKKVDVEKLIAEKYEAGQLPTTTQSKEFHLVKEKDGWKVFLDWKTQKETQEKKEKISSLLSEAKQLEKSKNLTEAIQKYEAVLILDGKNTKAKKALIKTKEELETLEKKKKYLQNMTLDHVKVSEVRNRYGDAIPIISGTIINNGNKSLKEVEITIYFLNDEGTVIGEKDFYPVLVSKYSFSRNNKALKPNYEKDFSYSVDDYAPSSWTKNAKVEITNIEFE